MVEEKVNEKRLLGELIAFCDDNTDLGLYELSPKPLMLKLQQCNTPLYTQLDACFQCTREKRKAFGNRWAGFQARRPRMLGRKASQTRCPLLNALLEYCNGNIELFGFTKKKMLEYLRSHNSTLFGKLEARYRCLTGTTYQRSMFDKRWRRLKNAVANTKQIVDTDVECTTPPCLAPLRRSSRKRMLIEPGTPTNTSRKRSAIRPTVGRNVIYVVLRGREIVRDTISEGITQMSLRSAYPEMVAAFADNPNVVTKVNKRERFIPPGKAMLIIILHQSRYTFGVTSCSKDIRAMTVLLWEGSPDGFLNCVDWHHPRMWKQTKLDLTSKSLSGGFVSQIFGNDRPGLNLHPSPDSADGRIYLPLCCDLCDRPRLCSSLLIYVKVTNNDRGCQKMKTSNKCKARNRRPTVAVPLGLVETGGDSSTDYR